MRLTIRLHLELSSRMMELHFQYPIRFHGKVLNYLTNHRESFTFYWLAGNFLSTTNEYIPRYMCSGEIGWLRRTRQTDKKA
jgi:hypothetical protein